MAKPLFDQFSANCFQFRTHANLRDSLPRSVGLCVTGIAA